MRRLSPMALAGIRKELLPVQRDPLREARPAPAMGMPAKGAYPAIAPVSSALPPPDPGRVKGKCIFRVHGAQGWIFPAGWTVRSCRDLRQAGADIRLKIIDDFSHPYPREANAVILDWFGMR